MKTTQEIIESILAKNSDSVMTGREVYSEMEENEKGMFPGGVDAVNKALCYLRNKGVVENGISEIVNGRTTLTWKINNAQDQQKTETIEQIETVDQIETEQTEVLDFMDFVTEFSDGFSIFCDGVKKMSAELEEEKLKVERLNEIIENINNLLTRSIDS